MIAVQHVMLWIHRLAGYCCVTVDLQMWQSRVEIEGYSVAYFDRIAAFEEPFR